MSKLSNKKKITNIKPDINKMKNKQYRKSTKSKASY